MTIGDVERTSLLEFEGQNANPSLVSNENPLLERPEVSQFSNTFVDDQPSQKKSFSSSNHHELSQTYCHAHRRPSRSPCHHYYRRAKLCSCECVACHVQTVAGVVSCLFLTDLVDYSHMPRPCLHVCCRKTTKRVSRRNGFLILAPTPSFLLWVSP
jgi:hypothetical protein